MAFAQFFNSECLRSGRRTSSAVGPGIKNTREICGFNEPTRKTVAGIAFAYQLPSCGTELPRLFCHGPGIRVVHLLRRQDFTSPYFGRAEIPGDRINCEHYNSFGRKAHVAWRCGGSCWRQWFHGQFGADGRHLGRHQLQANFGTAQFHRHADVGALRLQRLQQVGDEEPAAEAGLQGALQDDRDRARSSTRRSPTSSPSAMKDWAIEKGATHYAHVFYPADRPDGRKARQLPLARRRRRRDGRVHRQAADPGRARRLELPDRRHPRHVRSPRLHDLGRHQPGLHSGKPERHDALHSDGVRLLDRRSARQEDAAAAFDAGAQQAGPAHAEAVRQDRRRVRRLDRRPRAGILPDRPPLLLRPARPADRRPHACSAPSRRRARSSKIITSARFPSACWPSCWKSSASCSSSAFRSRRATTKWPRPSTKSPRCSSRPTWRPITSS